MSQAEGGYECNFTSEVPDELMICVFCHLPLKVPIQLSDCGHRFCKSCFDQFVNYAMEKAIDLLCPNDRKLIDRYKVFTDKAAERAVLSLSVYCDYVSNGCEWTGELQELEIHKEKCPRQKINDNVDASNIDLLERIQQL